MALPNLENPAPRQPPIENPYFKNTSNRAQDVRRDTDLEKNFSITLLDVDTAIKSHIDTVIVPTIIDNGSSVVVPVIYGSPERWKAIQADGYFRDKNGKIQLPAIMLKRNSFSKNDNMMSFNRYLSYPVMKKYSEKNKYDKFSLLNASSITPVQQIHSVTMPDHIKVEYSVMIWTDKVEQMNGIIEKINFACNDYWGDLSKFKFRVTTDTYSHITEVSADKDRMVRTEFTLTVYAYLLADSFEDRKSTVQKFLTPRTVKIVSEVVDGQTMNALKSSEKLSKNPSGLGMTNNIIYKINATLNRLSRNEITGSDAGTSKLSFTYGPKLPADYGEEGWMSYDGQYHYIYSNGTWYKQSIEGFH